MQVYSTMSQISLNTRDTMGVTSRVETVRLSNVQCASQSMDEKKRDKEDMNAQFWNHII